MWIKIFFSKLFHWWRALHLADRLLLVFMTILLAQSAHNLLFHELTLSDGSVLDVVIRTTSAAIFGYFISAGFRSASEQDPAAAPRSIGFTPNSELDGTPAARIGFTAQPPTQPETDATQPGLVRGSPPAALRWHNQQQLIIVSIVGISSLLLLVISRNNAQPSATSIATLSQLRDFVSASVGFLIGHTGTEHK